MLYLIYLATVALLVFVDQIVKKIIVNNFELYDSKTIIDNFFNLTYIRNYGAGFSILQNQRIVLSVVALVAIAVLGYLLITSKKDESLGRISYLLIISGTIGNLIDRIRLGYVVDFLDFNIFGFDFPIFNVADCFITVGCFLIILIILVEGKYANH